MSVGEMLIYCFFENLGKNRLGTFYELDIGRDKDRAKDMMIGNKLDWIRKRHSLD